MNSPYTEASEIAKRLRSEMPISLTLHDPVSGQPYTIERDNILRMLVVDAPNIITEAQMVPLLYGEMARAQRACERAASSAERSFVGWKASVAAEARSKAAKEGGKITNDAASEAYRTHPDYAEKANLATYYEKLAGLFEDFKKAFDIKGRMIEAVLRTHAGDFRAQRVHGNTTEMESEAQRVFQNSGTGGQVPPAPPGTMPLPPPPPPVRGRTSRPLNE